MSNNDSSIPEFTIHIITEADTEDVLQCLRLYFFPEEPLNFNIIRPDDEERFLIHVMPLGTSMVARSTSGTVLGVFISGHTDADYPENLLAEAAACSNEMWSWQLRLMALTHKQANIIGRFNVTQVLHGYAACVRTELQGSIIADRILKAQLDLARECGYLAYSVDCTSFYAANHCARANMLCVNKLAYADFRNAWNEPIFNPPLPHTHVQTFVKLL